MQETELIKSAQNGNVQAFDELISAYEKKIYNIAYKFMRNDHDAQDAAQDAIIKMYGNLKKFSFQSAFSTWMYRVTANTCLDILRKKKANAQIDDFENVITSRDGNPDKEALNNELGAGIKSCIRMLPEKYIPIIVLKDVEGMKYEEIAEIMKISVGTVKSRISRAREKLRELLITKKIL
ncbi:sigma-70 family RNA polymerase sigma factor [Christensenellaceae bacterium OttesenSCG-928-K19]|nr:sigma-70 family RNA polymerase sigma factor [Christensenellaceae bacterium OttesenSCG-928-K19]